MTNQQKAQAALAARDSGDPRWPSLIFELMIRMNMSGRDVETEIVRMASSAHA